MQYGSLPGVSDRVSRLVMGSMVFSTDRFELTCDLLDRFVEAGGTAVDTARVYAKGTSEQAFGQWLQQRGGRERLVVIGKGAHHDSETFERRVNPDAIREDIRTSLDAMQLDRMDVYLLHKDDPDTAVGPIVEVLNEEAAAGRIGLFGGSSWTHERIQEANDYATAHGLRPFTVSSPNLALAVPNEPMWEGCVSLAGDPDAQAWYARTGMPILAWSSQARGFFSGRYALEAAAELSGAQATDLSALSADDRDRLNVIRTYYSEANWERYRRAGELAKERGRSLSQVALAWVLHQPLDVYALIGPRTVEELDDCLGALDIELAPDEVAWLNLQAERSPLAERSLAT
jgi:aryl-alcohol dehydrogenase-like predicted oxidoreductase